MSICWMRIVWQYFHLCFDIIWETNVSFSQACQRQFDVYMLFGLEQWIRVCHDFPFDANAHTGYKGGSIVIIKSLSADNIYVCVSQSRNKEF